MKEIDYSTLSLGNIKKPLTQSLEYLSVAHPVRQTLYFLEFLVTRFLGKVHKRANKTITRGHILSCSF